jgi:hypothetical protein
MLTFPVVIRTDNRVTKEGVYMKGETFWVKNRKEAEHIIGLLKETRGAIIAQEAIWGTGTGAFFLRFRDEVQLSFAHRRLHEVPYWGGGSSFRESCRDHELVSLGARLLEAVGYEGVAMVEFRRSSLDGRPYFVELNGRLWGSIALALHAGADFPRALVECYRTGQAPPQRPYRVGIKCRNIFPGEVGHVASILKTRAGDHPVPLPSKSQSLVRFAMLTLNPTIRHDYCWFTDPLPGVAQAVAAAKWVFKQLRSLAERKARRHWHAPDPRTHASQP